jgi:LuxR family maltose regulon positive regulatory protein
VDVLRQRLHQLHPDLVPARHRHASAWFEEEGFLTEAIRHALAAQDWGRAVRLIEASGMAVVLGKQVQTMLGWIDEIPEELVLERPALCTIHAIALAYSNRLDDAEIRVQEAEGYLRGSPTTDETRAILGRIAVIRSTMARYPGDLERCVAMARRALELLPETEATARERVAARVNATFAYQVSGDVTPSNEHLLEEAVASSRAVGDQIPLLRSINFLARLRTLQGRLRMAAATYEEAAEVVPGREGLRDVVNSAAYYVGLGDIHREWNDLDSAETHLRRGLDLVAGALMVDADVVTHGHLSLARLQQARGRYADARAVLEQFADLARRRHYSPILSARGEAAQARLALVRDDLPAAIVWAKATGLGAEGEPAYPREEEYLTLVRVLISQGRLAPMGSYLDDALGLLDRLLGAAEDGVRMGSVIEILTLRALALQARHESGGALAALESALVLAQPEGYVRVFVDEGAPMAALLSELLKARSRGPRDARRRVLLGHARWLLAAFESPRKSTDPPVPGGFAQDQDQPLLDPLTSREQEVLALIAGGFSNREIAARLFIEVGTVKGYVHSLLRKLGVENRTKAVARARGLRLVAG